MRGWILPDSDNHNNYTGAHGTKLTQKCNAMTFYSQTATTEIGLNVSLYVWVYVETLFITIVDKYVFYFVHILTDLRERSINKL